MKSVNKVNAIHIEYQPLINLNQSYSGIEETNSISYGDINQADQVQLAASARSAVVKMMARDCGKVFIPGSDHHIEALEGN